MQINREYFVSFLLDAAEPKRLQRLGLGGFGVAFHRHGSAPVSDWARRKSGERDAGSGARRDALSGRISLSDIRPTPVVLRKSAQASDFVRDDGKTSQKNGVKE